MTDEQTTNTETKRDRVRRLLIDPLTEHGFRKPGDVVLSLPTMLYQLKRQPH